jgi:hypothetical protein
MFCGHGSRYLQSKGGWKTMSSKKIFVFSIIVLLFSIGSSALVAEPYSILTGIVRGIHVHGVKKWLEVESQQDQAIINFRIGHNTRYNPQRYPGVGETVKVEYLAQRGVSVAYSVTILEGAKETQKEVPKKSSK